MQRANLARHMIGTGRLARHGKEKLPQVVIINRGKVLQMQIIVNNV